MNQQQTYRRSIYYVAWMRVMLVYNNSFSPSLLDTCDLSAMWLSVAPRMDNEKIHA